MHPHGAPFQQEASQAEHSSAALPDLLLVLVPSLSPHLRGLYIRWALVIWLGQHAHDRYEDLLHTLNR
jgi:hypothetical protein